ncbi:glycosyltransferase family 2 protein [Vibrio coralliilyticus]|uniref:glycosyltransferase family 2 protein n=1 Tax=Vibrio coralliilyticus TaxID=190893 RepID=UPI0015619D2A|nr:glycosyltransferase family 2 protein [Vibrio coralliilyticus]NRF31296.1 glycosyltransferase family 2 protein [Vibrio coralliilyticus]NRF54796.1 glycosyltransferase family 2 protein [Vibrio coralliilyticus]
MKKIAIAMATYNGRLFLEEQIESILNQTYTDWVLYIHDDVSTDGTVEIIDRYASLYPDKIKVIRDKIKFGNPLDNFSHIVSSIINDYDYYMFSDQDDYWMKNKIDVTLAKILTLENRGENLMKLVHSDLMVSDSELNIISRSMWDYQNINFRHVDTISLLAQNNITGCTVMFDRNVKKKLFPIPREALMHDWWLAVNVSHYGVIAYIDMPTIYYRQHSRNSVGAKKVSIFYYLGKIFNIKQVVNHYTKLYLMINKLDFKVSLYKVVIRKLGIIFDRVFCNWRNSS